MPILDDTTKFLMFMLLSIFVLLLLASFIRKLNIFINELRYINMEIGRNEGQEQEFWKRKKKRLWRIFLPFNSK